MHKFGKSTTVTEVFYFYPDLSNTGEYRFALDAASVTKINKWLGWQMTLSDRYVTNPPIAGTKSNDIIFSPPASTSASRTDHPPQPARDPELKKKSRSWNNLERLSAFQISPSNLFSQREKPALRTILQVSLVNSAAQRSSNQWRHPEEP